MAWKNREYPHSKSRTSNRGLVGSQSEKTFTRIHHVIRNISWGRLKTYGQVAGEAGVSARTVVWALHNCPADVPWHRVVGKEGRILLARRSLLLGAEQAHRLSQEGWNIMDWKVSKAGGGRRKRRAAGGKQESTGSRGKR